MVAIWDTRRPYITYASFIEHTSDMTSMYTSSMYVISQVFGQLHTLCTCANLPIAANLKHGCLVAITGLDRPFSGGVNATALLCVLSHLTDFLWLNDQVLLSYSKDSKLIQQLFSEAEKPAKRMVSDIHEEMYVYL